MAATTATSFEPAKKHCSTSLDSTAAAIHSTSARLAAYSSGWWHASAIFSSAAGLTSCGFEQQRTRARDCARKLAGERVFAGMSARQYRYGLGVY